MDPERRCSGPAGLMAAAADGKPLVDDVCAKKAIADLTRT
jgi:hypothetical protein